MLNFRRRAENAVTFKSDRARIEAYRDGKLVAYAFCFKGTWRVFRASKGVPSPYERQIGAFATRQIAKEVIGRMVE